MEDFLQVSLSYHPAVSEACLCDLWRQQAPSSEYKDASVPLSAHGGGKPHDLHMTRSGVCDHGVPMLTWWQSRLLILRLAT